MKKDSGKLYQTPDGKIGRTYERHGLIGGKLCVYLATHFNKGTPIQFSTNGRLYRESILKFIGFID
jgi:hypothetical protein